MGRNKDDDYDALWRENSGWDAPEGAKSDDYIYDEERDVLVNNYDEDDIIYKKPPPDEY